MATIGGYSRHKQLSELNTALRTNNGVYSPAVQKAKARANLGLGSGASVTFGTATPLTAMVTDANNGIKGYRDTRNPPLFNQQAANALNATGTVTAAMLIGVLITSTTAAAVTATLDTGTNLETALIAVYPNLQNNDWFEINVINTGANAFTFATAAGWTDGGNAFTAVAAGTSAMFGIRRTAANTYTIYKVA